MKFISVWFFCLLFLIQGEKLTAQFKAPSFGKGIQIMAQDSSFYLKFGFRFQTLFQSSWNLQNDELSSFEDYQSAIFIRRSRLKFDGWAISPKLKYKLELALSNRDNGGGNSQLFNNAANIILDANITWNFHRGWSLWAGQGKMLGNRERIVSSGDLQFVDRSRLNSRFNIDRDVGIMILHKQLIGDRFIIKKGISITSGEGKNVTAGNLGGMAYGAKIEFFPFGDFQAKGAYTGSAIKYEDQPKLAFAIAYEFNDRAGRTRGQLGSFLFDIDGESIGKDLNSWFVDLMFKYQNWSVMAEYAQRGTGDESPNILNDVGSVIGTYYTGNATNIAVGYMFENDVEFAVRWTDVNPEVIVASPEVQYTLGLSKYIREHKLKVQTDLTYRLIEFAEDDVLYRLQLDFHF